MWKQDSALKLVECPQKKTYLTGSKIGSMIMVPVDEKEEGTCPAAGVCKSTCKFNK